VHDGPAQRRGGADEAQQRCHRDNSRDGAVDCAEAVLRARERDELVADRLVRHDEVGGAEGSPTAESGLGAVRADAGAQSLHYGACGGCWR
jgi:hypothetical protein